MGNKLDTKVICTLNDAWTEWLKGNKFPIAFFGDSTIDGANTSNWIENSIGTDHQPPYAFPKRLEKLLIEATSNPSLRIYNAGFSGRTSSHGVEYLEEEFSGSSPYHDVKMVGIGFGINDRLLYENEKAYRDGFKANIKAMIHWFYSKNIQPFLLTTQAILQPGVSTQYADEYPMRTSCHIETIANEVKRELAKEYHLELIDVNQFTEMFLLYSAYSAVDIISDTLHFGDIGHQYEAELLFAHLCPQTIIIDSNTKIDYSTQKIINSVPDDWVTMAKKVEDKFKVFVNHIKADAEDMKIMDVWVFNSGKEKIMLKAFKSIPETLTYVKVNGVLSRLTNLETILDLLDLGLHRIEVFTGASTFVDFKGFIMTYL